MSYRTKRSVVYVVGTDGGDTSALISALINNDDNNNDKNNEPLSSTNERLPSPSTSSTSSSSFSSSTSSSSQNGIIIHEWTPYYQKSSTIERNNSQEKAPEDVTLQVWEFNGSKAHEQVQTVINRPPCLIVVFLGVDQDDWSSTITRLTQVLNGLQAKCPGSHVIIALSQSSTTTTNTNTNDNRNNNDDDNNDSNVIDDNKEVSRRMEEIQTASTDWGTQWKQSIEREILDIECDIQISINKEVSSQTDSNENDSKRDPKEMSIKHTERLQTHIREMLNIHETVLTVNTSNGQGVPELRKTVIEKAISRQLFPHLTQEVQDEMLKVIDYIQEVKDAGNVMIPLTDFDAVIQQISGEKEKSRDQLMVTYRQLQELGYILLMTQTPTQSSMSEKRTTNGLTLPARTNPFPAPFVCTNPEAFANMILGCLIEDDKKTYKLEANRFWPKHSGFKPPDPDLLARVLEILPQEGCIREAALPILWQEYASDQNQMINTLRCLQSLGVLVFYEKSVQDCAGLAMPNYTLLSAQNTHASVLMDMIPKKKPQLNWTSKPFKDDIQVTWRLSAVTCLPSLVVKRCLAHIKTFFQPLCDYIHIWDEGVLIKFPEATICVEIVRGGNSLHVSCRVNADDEVDITKIIQRMWVHLASVVKVETEFLSWQLPGVEFQTKIGIYGIVFFATRPSDSEVEISLVKSLTSWRLGGQLKVFEGMIELNVKLDVLFPFEDETVWTPREWIDLVLAKAEQLNMSLPDKESREKHLNYKKKKQLPRNKPRKNGGAEVKWKSEVVESDTKEDNTQNPGTVNQSLSSVSDNDVTAKTASGDPTLLTVAPHAALTKEEWKKKASDLASQFVSCTMALAVADFVALKSQNLKGPHTEAQVTAARLTANAALAVHTGDVSAAAKAVIEAVQEAHGNVGKKGKSNNTASSQNGGHQSKLCTIL